MITLKNFNSGYFRYFLLALIICCGFWIALAVPSYTSQAADPHQFSLATKQLQAPTGSQTPVFETRPVSIIQDPTKAVEQVHAASLAMIGPNQLFATWYGGTREGARDVQIYSSRFLDNRWTEPRVIMTTQHLSKNTRRSIKKLGNPVAVSDNNGTVWVFFVSVTVGGWGGGAINVMHSTDNGENFSNPERLITSPFINISTHVRNPPFLYANGDIGVPVYHEFIGKFSEILRLNQSGEVINKQRISRGDRALQPSVAIYTPHHASLWHRNGDRAEAKVLFSTSTDGGETWSRTIPTALPNPDSGLTSLALTTGQTNNDSSEQTLLVFNNSTTARDRLSMAHVTDAGQQYTTFFDLKRSESDTEHSYPQLIKDITHDFYHLVYTSNRRTIEHVKFNHAWLNQQLVNAGIDPLPAFEPTAPVNNTTAPARQSSSTTSSWILLFARTIPILLAVWGLLVLSVRTLSSRFDWPQTFNLKIGNYIVSLIVCFTALHITWASTSVIYYLRGFFGDLSAASWVIIGTFCIGIVATPRKDAAQIIRQKLELYCVIACISLLFYPFTLGLTYFDPYALGYAMSEYSYVIPCMIILLAFWFRHNPLLLTWFTLVFFFTATEFFESANIWDYLLDPVAGIISLIWLKKYFFKRTLNFR